MGCLYLNILTSPYPTQQLLHMANYYYKQQATLIQSFWTFYKTVQDLVRDAIKQQ